MASLAIVIFTGLFDELLRATLVGIAFFTLFRHKIRTRSSWKVFSALTFVFAVLDIYWLPAMFSLQATITIGNKQIADAFDLKRDMDIGELFSPGFSSVFFWIIQAIVGHFVGSKVVPLGHSREGGNPEA